MNKSKNSIKGAIMVEYILVIAVILGAAYTALSGFGDQIGSSFDGLVGTLSGHMPA